MTLTEEYLREYLNHWECSLIQRSILIDLLSVTRGGTEDYFILIEFVKQFKNSIYHE